MNRKIFLYSLTSLAVTAASSLAYAEELVTAPTFEGGITASIGALYLTPSADNLAYAVTRDLSDDGDVFVNDSTVHSISPGYDWGIEASLGYIFEGTANGIELSYRNLSTHDTGSTLVEIDAFPAKTLDHEDFFDVNATTGFELNAFDLMISQYMDIGDHMQMRFNAGLAYVELEEQGTIDIVPVDISDEPYFLGGSGTAKSEFTGWGPRIGIDARYDFGQGFGIVGGGSTAYYLGDADFSSTDIEEFYNGTDIDLVTNDIDNHAVTNLRANIGIDYVVFFDNEERSTLGLELGYLVDYYANGVVVTGSGGSAASVLPYDVTFSGPYLNLKGAF